MNRRMTVAELFAYSRQQDQQAMAMQLSAQMRAREESAAREEQLARMRTQSQAQLAGLMTEAGVPGAGMMLARQGLSPRAIQMAAAMANRASDVNISGLGGI